MSQAPAIGRIVHHQQGDQVVAAIITAVHAHNGVNLTVFEPGMPPGYVSHNVPGNPPAVVPFAEVPTPWHWNWPPQI